MTGATRDTAALPEILCVRLPTPKRRQQREREGNDEGGDRAGSENASVDGRIGQDAGLRATKPLERGKSPSAKHETEEAGKG